MKIAVVGAGAIGNLVAGYLAIKGEDVVLVGTRQTVQAITDRGLNISGVRGDFNIGIDVCEKLDAPCDLGIFCTKTQDLEVAIRNNFEFLKNADILTTQNGVRADDICAQFFSKENITSSIVMFGATYLQPGEVVHNFDGNWVIGSMFGRSETELDGLAHFLKEIFPVVLASNIKGMKYLKLFVNANNCIPGILGLSMQEAFSDADVSRISIAIWKEGLEIVRKTGIILESLPDFPLERLTKLCAMPPVEAAKIYSQIMQHLSKEPLYGSILQSIKRGKSSEIDYINGEFVHIAGQNNIAVPLNTKLVALVHEVEKSGRFFSKEELINQTKDFIQ